MEKRLLMSYEDYSRVKHETPYYYSLKSGKQFLYYFGTNHSRNSQHSQYKLLVKKWNKFLKEVGNTKTVVIVETHKILTQGVSFEEFIRKHGEAGAGVFLAEQSKSLLIFGEPKIENIINHLLKKYSKEEILLYFESIALNFWHRNNPNISLERFLLEHNDKYRELLNWPDLVISTNLIKEIYKKVYNQDLNINDEKIFSEITSPVNIKSRINELSRSQSQFRNEYILDQIEKYWDEGYNLFIIYGAGHAVMQERAIRSLVKK